MGAKVTILTAPAAAGKSRVLIEQVRRRLREGRAGRVLMLVPTAADARAAAHLLLEGIRGLLAP
ncbi:MAG: hypothetical protein DRP79_05900, partial [Planctomycetota bacterium]